MIVLDTHALLWWAVDPGKLSRLARAKLAQVDDKGAFVSSISVWELGIKIKRGQLELGIGLREFVTRLERSSPIEIVPVDSAIWLASLDLDWDHRDPADRVIVATALSKGVPLLTKDLVVRSWGGVECVW